MGKGVYKHKPLKHWFQSGDKHPNWKCGVKKDKVLYDRIWREKHKDEINARRKKRRHENGISKTYNQNRSCLSKTKEYKRLYRKRYKYNKKNAGELAIKTIQLVYEDNIKKFGTLTCYLCFKPIEFGKDNLEHKNPLSRGGDNNYENLAVACQGCNFKKRNKTEAEFREVNKNNGKTKKESTSVKELRTRYTRPIYTADR